jgi:protein gp37
MSDNSKISWCDASWNPIRGCSRVSPGCGDSHGGGCYAERQAHRFSGPGKPYEGLTKLTAHGPRWTGKVRLVPELLDWPLRKKKPLRVFVNSMSDLFHEGLSDEEIAVVFAVMALAPQHCFQVLTKRPERMRRWFEWLRSGDLREAPEQRTLGLALAHAWREGAAGIVGPLVRGELEWPLPNVWLGVSVENQATADERIPLLLDTPAAVRWISAEPLLEVVRLESNLVDPEYCCWHCGAQIIRGPGNSYQDERRLLRNCVVCKASLDGRRRLDWVVAGGESGPSARPCDVRWIRSLRDQCQAAGTKVFVKQLGSRPVFQGADVDMSLQIDGPSLRLRHKAGADPSEWPEDLRVQEFPDSAG